MKEKNLLRLVLSSLIALSLTVYLGKSDNTLLRGIDSNIHAAVSMNIVRHGWLPELPMVFTVNDTVASDHIFNDHPFFYFWLNGLVMKAFGASAWTARLLTGLFSTGTVLLTYALGASLHSNLLGMLGALIFLFTRDMILTGASVSLDPPLLFFTLLTFLFWLKERWWLLGLSAGIGLWFKTPVVLLIYPTAWILSFIFGNPQQRRKLYLSAALSVLIGSLIWGVTALLGGTALVQDYWFRQFWGSVVQGRHFTFETESWMFFKRVKKGFLPFLPLLLLGLLKITAQKRYKVPLVLVCFVATSVLVLCVSASRFRMGYYFNPCFPFLALLSAYAAVDLFQKYSQRTYEGFVLFTPLLLSVLLIAPISFGEESFAALKRFIPFIQSYGQCSDRVLLVQGGEPIGSSMDYRLVLNFYTNHPIDIVTCADASAQIQNHTWLIISLQNAKSCLPQGLRFATELQMENFLLLSHQKIFADPLDLTALQRELKPSVNCIAPALPHDIYHRYE